MPKSNLNQYLHLLRKIARKLKRRLPPSVELGDLISDGFIGLERAARTFDPTRSIPFPFFACRAIEGAMLDGLRKRDWVPRQIRHQPIAAPVIHSLIGEPQHITDFEERIRQRESIPVVLGHLPRRQRLVVQLYYLENLSLGQIARALGVTESRISQLCSRTIRKLSLGPKAVPGDQKTPPTAPAGEGRRGSPGA